MKNIILLPLFLFFLASCTFSHGNRMGVSDALQEIADAMNNMQKKVESNIENDSYEVYCLYPKEIDVKLDLSVENKGGKKLLSVRAAEAISLFTPFNLKGETDTTKKSNSINIKFRNAYYETNQGKQDLIDRCGLPGTPLLSTRKLSNYKKLKIKP